MWVLLVIYEEVLSAPMGHTTNDVRLQLRGTSSLKKINEKKTKKKKTFCQLFFFFFKQYINYPLPNKKVQADNNQGKMQSERNSHSKNTTENHIVFHANKR